MIAMQASFDSRDWLKRNARGSVVWYQPLREAWMVLIGKQSLHRAWQTGLQDGSRGEFNRIIRKGGDLMPIIDATILVVAKDANAPVPNWGKVQELRAAAWKQYKSDQESAPLPNSVA